MGRLTFLLAAISATTQYSYVLFHSLVEIFRIVVIFGIAALAWNARSQIDNPFLLAVGLAYPSIGLLELLHTLAYKGMGIFPNDANLPTQLWVALRAGEGVVILLAANFLGRRNPPVIGFAAGILATGSVLVWAVLSGLFPDCFIEGQGLTSFKIMAEYAVIALFGTALYLLWRHRADFPGDILSLVLVALVSDILAEVAFTQYADVYGQANLVGHLLLLFSSYFLYRALLLQGIQKPQLLLFHQLKREKDLLAVSEAELAAKVAERTAEVVENNHQLQEQQVRIARLMRVYAVLSGINSAIVRIHERQELLDNACRIAVDAGRFGMAWIGYLQDDNVKLLPVASCGIDMDELKDLAISIGTETPSGTGTLYEAVHTRRAVFCNDIAAESQIGPVRRKALEHGYRSLCVLPLVVDGKGIGVMGLYAREAGFFDTDEIRLLDELAADISFALQYIQREERLNYLAYYDALTGLPNQTLFLDRLSQFLHGVKDSSLNVAVILFDLDHFTHLNETEGRHIGDAVLQEVAVRLQACVYEPCSLARTGADTYAVAMSGLRHGIEASAMVQERIFDALNRPLVVEGREFRITAHAGIALYPGDGDDGEVLYQSAEAALREAQSSGVRCLYYAPEINARTAANLALERDLRTALELGQFVVHFQPRVDLRSGAIVGAEALIRWRHPERGIIPPAEFIPMAEQTGLIVPIGAWVIDVVCAQQAAWLAEGMDIVPVAVNLSPVQFAHGGLLPTLEGALVRHGLEAKYLELELTESLVMQDPKEAAETMKGFRRCGLRLSLDDFGTGYSSLAYLTRFPFDFVKIDRAFISDITRNPGDAAIATAVIAMAHRLNLQVVAEGVETEGQLCYLRQHGCDQIQGYYFSPPVPAGVFAGMLQAAKRLSFEEERPEGAAGTILLVDDEPGILSALQRVLRREGYRILKASSGQEGLDLLAVNRVQVIVSDQRMPGMSGSEFLSIVKELYPDTIRIILSGYTDLQAVTDAVNRGAVYKFLTKPWEDDLLKEHIRDAFLRCRQAGAAREEAASGAAVEAA